MSETAIFLAVFFIGVVSSMIGTMVGGGSLLSIPLLIFLGLPPHVAIATDRFAGLGAGVTALYKYAKAKKIVWKHVPILSLITLIGSLIGATILINVRADSLNSYVGLIILLLLPVLFLKPDAGVSAQSTSRSQTILGLTIYFAIQVLAGFFGGGTGTLIFYTLVFFFGLTIIQAVATQIIPFIILTISSSVLFALDGIIDYRLGVILMVAAAIGGYLGAGLAVEKGERWVRSLFALVVLLLGIKLIFI